MRERTSARFLRSPAARKASAACEPIVLRHRDADEGADERQVPPVAGGAQGVGRLRQVLQDRGRIAERAVAEGELVMR